MAGDIRHLHVHVAVHIDDSTVAVHNTDTPIPPDEPRSENPPDCVMISYHLKAAAENLSLEILDAAGAVVRRYEKGVNPNPDPRAEGHWPDLWIAAWPELKASPGLHRFAWDLRRPRPDVAGFSNFASIDWGASRSESMRRRGK